MRHPRPAALNYVVRIIAIAATTLGASACVLVANNGTSLSYRQNRAASPSARGSMMPTSLGQHVVGTVSIKRSAIFAADSTLRAWGWTIAAFDSDRGTLRTDWGYTSIDGLAPKSTQGCDSRNAAALRLFLDPATVGTFRDSTRFTLRGETIAANSDDRGDNERAARRAFETMTAALQEVLLQSDSRGSTSSPTTHGAVAGSVGRDGFILCGTMGV